MTTKLVKIIIKDDRTAVYDFVLSSQIDAGDIATTIANKYNTSLYEDVSQTFNRDNQLTFSFAG